MPRELTEPREANKRYVRRGKKGTVHEPASRCRPLAISRPALESQDHREEGEADRGIVSGRSFLVASSLRRA
jgi:hypothetical protein